MGLKIGVIGTGHLGRQHVRVFQDLEVVDFVACHDKDIDRASRTADDFGATAYDRPQDLLAAVDAVSSATPLALSAGGWGQMENVWASRNDPGYQEMAARVAACIVPHAYQDVAGTCGRGSSNGCLCAACWVRERIDGATANWDGCASRPRPERK